MRDRWGTPSRTVATLAVALLGLALGGPEAEAANRTVDVENVRVGFGERYKVGTWTPIWIQLRGGPDGFSGYVALITPDEDGTPTSTRQAVQVAPGASQRLTSYVRTGSLDPDFATIRFIDGKTLRRAANDVVIGNLLSNKPPEPLSQADYQVVTLGRPQGVELIPGLPGYNANKQNAASPGRAREVAIPHLETIDDLLPGRWYGYDSVDVVAIDTNDRPTLASLNAGRGEALRQWVERGGHLVVAVSGNWQAVNDSLLGPMLPCRLGGQTQATPFDSLESFTGGSQQVAFENQAMQVAKLDDIEGRGGRVIASTLANPLVVRGPYGFGRVTVVGLDTDTKPFASWPDRAAFWVKVLDLKGSSTGVEGQKGQARIIRQDVSDLATLLRRALDQFRGVTLIPFGWVAGFIGLYILLIGPGDYFFLKKVLKRMELTWITFPTIVITVSLLAYYAAYLVKGTDLRINKVDVVDVDLDGKVMRGTAWANLFSPQNRDYSIAVVPASPDRETSNDPRAVVPAAPGTEVVTTWFGAPESGLRGMNTRNRGMGLGNGGYSYGPVGKVEELDDVRIGIWSTKGIISRWFAPAPSDPKAIVEVDLQPVGTDRLAGTVTNRLTVPLKDAVIAFGKQVYYKLGTIAPGASVQVDATLDRSLAEYLKEAQGSYLSNNYGQVEAIDRPRLMMEMMFHDGGPAGEEVVPSRTQHDLDLTGQLALGRPMLVAQVDRAVTQLVLGNAPSDPKVDQTTLLRVILPLKKEAVAKAR